MVRARHQQFLNCFAADRIHEVRGDLCQGGEDKSARTETRMRNDEAGLLNNVGSVEDDVDVEGSWPLGSIPDAMAFGLDREANAE